MDVPEVELSYIIRKHLWWISSSSISHKKGAKWPGCHYCLIINTTQRFLKGMSMSIVENITGKGSFNATLSFRIPDQFYCILAARLGNCLQYCSMSVHRNSEQVATLPGLKWRLIVISIFQSLTVSYNKGNKHPHQTKMELYPLGTSQLPPLTINNCHS